MIRKWRENGRERAMRNFHPINLPIVIALLSWFARLIDQLRLHDVRSPKQSSRTRREIFINELDGGWWKHSNGRFWKAIKTFLVQSLNWFEVFNCIKSIQNCFQAILWIGSGENVNCTIYIESFDLFVIRAKINFHLIGSLCAAWDQSIKYLSTATPPSPEINQTLLWTIVSTDARLKLNYGFTIPFRREGDYENKCEQSKLCST